MSRIKKRGLEYFPMDADFTRKPAVRRIMKKEGEGAAVVLIEVLCAIYSQEGYYVKADELFYEDIAAGCYERNEHDVKRIIGMAIEYGMFHAAMFAEHGILTSEDIQQQFLHCTRRRVNTHLLPQYVLVADVDAPEVQPQRAQRNHRTRQRSMHTNPAQMLPGHEYVTDNGLNVTAEPHSIAKQSINTPLQFPQGGEEEEFNASPVDGEPNTGVANTVVPRGVPVHQGMPITQEQVDRLQPPADGIKRNYDGLLQYLRQFRVPPVDQYAIIRKSNYGIIGHPIWKGFMTLHASGGKIKLPGRYL